MAPSLSRLQEFKRCQGSKSANDVLRKVAYDKVMTAAQLTEFIQVMKAAGHEMDADFGSEAMQHASELLCRWPRPRELGSWAKKEGIELKYHRALVQLKCPKMSEPVARRAAGKLVGAFEDGKLVPAEGMTSSFWDITREHNLMYMWMHKPQHLCRVVYMYGMDKDELMDAARVVAELAVKLGFAAKTQHKTSKLSATAPEFVPQEKRSSTPATVTKRSSSGRKASSGSKAKASEASDEEPPSTTVRRRRPSRELYATPQQRTAAAAAAAAPS